jgi:hypothetical protein
MYIGRWPDLLAGPAAAAQAPLGRRGLLCAALRLDARRPASEHTLMMWPGQRSPRRRAKTGASRRVSCIGASTFSRTTLSQAFRSAEAVHAVSVTALILRHTEQYVIDWLEQSRVSLQQFCRTSAAFICLAILGSASDRKRSCMQAAEVALIFNQVQGVLPLVLPGNHA